MKRPQTIFESRLLPSIIGCFLLVFAGLVFFSSAPDLLRTSVLLAAIAVALLPFYRCFRPRLIFHFDQGKLKFYDVFCRKMVEFDLAAITCVKVEEATLIGGAEGGIGFEKRLILESENGPVTLRFPFLEISSADLLKLFQENLKNSCQ